MAVELGGELVYLGAVPAQGDDGGARCSQLAGAGGGRSGGSRCERSSVWRRRAAARTAAAVWLPPSASQGTQDLKGAIFLEIKERGITRWRSCMRVSCQRK